jgi:hypothetical protein
MVQVGFRRREMSADVTFNEREMFATFGHRLMTALRSKMVLGTLFSGLAMFVMACFLPLRFQSAGFVVVLSLAPICGIGVEAAMTNPSVRAAANQFAAACLAPLLASVKSLPLLLASVKSLPLRLRVGILLVTLSVTLSVTLLVWLAYRAKIERDDAQIKRADVWIWPDKSESKNEVNPRDASGQLS